MIKDNIISFDFDGTIADNFDGTKNLHRKETRDFILRLIRRGYIVYIITRRYGPDNSSMGMMDEHVDVFKVAEELGIPKERIIFTGRKWKYSFVKSIEACMHIDDDDREKYWIDRHLPDVKTIFLGSIDWQEQLIHEIDQHNKIAIWIKNKKNKLSIGMIIFVIIFMVILLFS